MGHVGVRDRWWLPSTDRPREGIRGPARVIVLSYRCSARGSYGRVVNLGMTFQVSDTAITAKRVRGVALHHALLSYVYGAVIVAIVANSVGGLLGHY